MTLPTLPTRWGGRRHFENLILKTKECFMDNDIDFVALIEPVAKILFRDKPCSRRGKELRYGTNGSLKVDLEKGTWKDFESDEGGGVLALIVRERGGDHASAMELLRREGLIARSNGNGAPRKVAKESDYTDETGNFLYQSIKYDPKGFSQRRRGPDGGWINNLDGVRRVLYRLPEVIAGVAAGRTIHIVEGEKDADNLRELGLVATTNAMGAGKWDATYNEVLRGAEVVIIGDNDEPGRKHVQDVARQLTGVAKRVRVLDLAAH
jgi:hypothetical protein